MNENRKKQPQEEMVAVPKDALEWAKNAGLVVLGTAAIVGAGALFVDNLSGVGVFDDGVAVALLAKAAQLFSQVFGSCQVAY